MSLGIVGRKCGMTRFFSKNGDSIPVTVVHVEPNKVTQVKTLDLDGYSAIQITTGSKKRSRINKPSSGHFAKSNVEPGRILCEFRVDSNQLHNFNFGSVIEMSLFSVGQKVDVSGISKGKGFQGVVKRHNFAMQDATHGNSLSHRVHGSTGQNQTPGRVFKNKKMAGQMGNVRKTVQTLEVIKIDTKNGILLLKGGVPGSTGGNIIVTPAVKVS